MVGLVLVSHSAGLAEGLREMVAQVAGDDVPVATAGGTDDGRLGTSAPRIADAIRATLDAGADDVLVLVDLGSAVLSLELALDEFGPADRSRRPRQRRAARRGRGRRGGPGERRRRDRRSRRRRARRSRAMVEGGELTMAGGPPVRPRSGRTPRPPGRPVRPDREPVPERHRPRDRRQGSEREEPGRHPRADDPARRPGLADRGRPRRRRGAQRSPRRARRGGRASRRPQPVSRKPTHRRRTAPWPQTLQATR